MPRSAVVLFSLLGSLSSLAAAPADYSKEALVFQNLKTVVHFAADGTAETVSTVSVKIQSDGAARQFGVLSVASTFGEKSELSYVRVLKPDGKVIETPVSEAMDVASPVAQVAPMYSDLRQQQLPVKGLAIGDTLEFSSRSVRSTPEIPNQYWFTFNFDRDEVILSQDLEIYAPKAKYLNVVSPEFKPVISEDGSTRRFSWHYEQLKPTPSQQDKMPKSVLPKSSDIQISTFRSWEELGAWYATLANPQAEVTPAVAAKAAELTKGLATPDEKVRALYNYVAAKYRYISISFGIGRYKPHTAQEVVQNGYGDCKDKHTLLAALLKASGIDASTVLIGAGMAFDRNVPSPAQFNHVITAVRLNGHTDWLDTTAEVAPYGLLLRQIRDHQALVIDPHGNAAVEKTPADPPFSSEESITVDSTLDKDGVLTGHFDMRFHGDTEVIVRALFHETAPAQWPHAIHSISTSLGFAGDISNATVENVNNLEKPLHISYDYKQPNYSDWAEHKIAPPLPPISVPYEGPDAEKPADDIDLFTPGKIDYEAAIRLPKGYGLQPPRPTGITTAFADYHANYWLTDGEVHIERTLEAKKSKAPLAQWNSYRELADAVYEDHNSWMQLTPADAAELIPNNPDAAKLIDKANADLRSQDFFQAKADLDKASALAPKQYGLWHTLAISALMQGNPRDAAADIKREIEYHPDNSNAYKFALVVFGMQRDEASAISMLQAELKQFPHRQDALTDLAGIFARSARWTDLAAMIEAESKQNAELAPNLQAEYAAALLRTGKKAEGLALAQKLKTASNDPLILNNLAWSLADTETDLDLAAQCEDDALSQLHAKMQGLDLDHFETADLMQYALLSATWDTAGWLRFKQGKLSEAEGYTNAAFRLSPRADIADHLGQILMKEGKPADAVAAWRMGLAADSKSDTLRQRLKSAPPIKGANQARAISPSDALNALRTIPLKGFARDSGNSEYFLLLSAGRVLDARLVGGELSGSDVEAAIGKASYSANPPGDGTKIIRKGILSCSAYTRPKCEIVLMPIENTQK